MRGYDDHDDRLSVSTEYIGARTRRYIPQHERPPTPPPQPEIRIVQVEVPVERVVVQTRVAPLPKNVGEVLLSHARRGADSCPIAATPFSECTQLCVTSCFHVFDFESLTRWQSEHTSCPVCRCKIENVVSEARVDGVPAV
jgi:hypothetical protein